MKKCEVKNCKNELFYEGLCQGHFYMVNPPPEIEVKPCPGYCDICGKHCQSLVPSEERNKG